MTKIRNAANSPYNLRDGNMQKVRIAARSIFEVVDNEDDADNETKFFFTDRQLGDMLKMHSFVQLKDDAEVTPVAEHIKTLYGSSVLPSMIELAENNEVPLGAVVIRAHKESELSIADWNALEADDREARLAEMVEAMKAEAAEPADDADDEQEDDGDDVLTLPELRAKYKKLANKKAPKSWKEERLTQEIAALEE